ncbi:ATP-binding protein [Streptomyces albogriseolus]|uniref:ATP-binding protein n=1 Tax=Streptomyces albogriseolus TaxID=1887 RepID=UPI003D73B56C
MTTSPRQERRSALPLPLADQTVLSFRFTPSPRGARLARRLACCQMDAWGRHHGTPAHDAVELITAELANNAVTHGRVPGRDAELRLTTDRDNGLVRVEVSDTRGEHGPRVGVGDPGAEGGRGLLLVAALADAWGVGGRTGGPGKTVWAVVGVPTGTTPLNGLPAAPSGDPRGTYAADEADPAGTETGRTAWEDGCSHGSRSTDSRTCWD